MEFLNFIETPIKDSTNIMPNNDFNRLLLELETKFDELKIKKQVSMASSENLAKFLNKNKDENKTCDSISNLCSVNLNPLTFIINSNQIIGEDKVFINTLAKDEVLKAIESNKKLIERLFDDSVVKEFISTFRTEFVYGKFGILENSYNEIVLGRIICLLYTIDYINSIIGISDSINAVLRKLEWFENKAKKENDNEVDCDNLSKVLKSIKQSIEVTTNMWNSSLALEVISIEENYMNNNKEDRNMVGFINFYVNKSYELLTKICYYYGGNNYLNMLSYKKDDDTFKRITNPNVAKF